MHPCTHPSKGDRFGRLVIVDDTPSMRRHRQRAFEVECDCGVRKIVLSAALRTGHTVSCGCFNRDKGEARFRAMNTTHGLSGTSTREVWASMIARCARPKNKEWHNYGGRGIRVCDRWLGRDGLSNFVADMGMCPPGLTLDRKDTNGNYEPSNCRWATTEEQGFNKRTGRLSLADMERLLVAGSADEVRAIAAEVGVSTRYANSRRRKKAAARGLVVPMFGTPRKRAA